MDNHLPTPVYSLEYAHEVIDQFVDKLGRATAFFANKLGYDAIDFRRLLVNLFRYRNARWNVVRDCIKYFDKYDLYDDVRQYDAENFRIWLTSVKTLVEDDLIDRKKLGKPY